MSDPQEDKRTIKEKEDEDEFLKQAMERMDHAIKSDQHNRVAALEDLRFLNGDQWDQGEKQRRKIRGRPTLQINVLPKYSKQVCGEMRKNKVHIKIHPVDSKADIQLARIREGIIYNVEYLSNAESIYDHAGKMLVDCGYGAWRVGTRYIEDDENPFLQEIYMERILNPFTVYMDPAAKDSNFSDAEWCFITSRISRDDFKEEYGDAFVPGGNMNDTPTTGTASEHWWDRDNVTIAEYFYTVYEEKEMCFLSDGQSLEKSKAEEFIAGAKRAFKSVSKENPEVGISDVAAPTILKQRIVKIPHIKWAKITSTKILDQKDWAGRIIPVILVTGEETVIDGKKYIKGLIRDAKDPQKLLNYWHSSACETVALAPKAPWLATAKQIEGYEQDYLSANEDNNPVLLYNIDPSNPNSTPLRQGVGQAPMAIFTEIGRAEQNIKNAIGMYNADVGDTSQESLRDVSGKAITARQMPGDTATFIYPDKMAQAIGHGGRIINDLIPAIYDTERDARLRTMDGSESSVPINTTTGNALSKMQANPQKFSGMDISKLQNTIKKEGTDTTSFNDITSGKYDVVVSSGPTFATQRAEAVENMVKLAMARNMSPVDKYFILKNCDFPGADEYAEVIRRMIPPNIMPPKPGQAPVPPPPIPPKAQVDLAKAQVEGAKQKTEQIKLQVELVKLQKEIGETDSGIKKQILDVEAELQAPNHPADEQFNQQLAAQQQAPQLQQGEGM